MLMQVNTILKHRKRLRNWLAVVGTLICLGVSSAGAQRAQVKAVNSTPKPVSSGVADQKAVNSFFRAVVAAKIAAKNKGDSKPTVKDEAWYLPDEWCVAKLGYPKGKSLEGCMVYAVSGHTAAIIHAELYCEPEHCEADFYLMSGTAGPRRLVGDVYGPWVLSPDRKSLFLGHTGMGVDDNGSLTGTYEALLTRIDVATLKKSYANGCASPVLSPGKKWIVCRDADGHVHRMPPNGGKLELVHRVDLGKETINIDAHIGVSLNPVSFLDRGRMQIQTLTRENQELKTKVIIWKE
jgi:hypothetical protein